MRLSSNFESATRESLPPAVILAGGLGTRLREVYAGGPKCLAPVAGRPFLDYILSWLRSEEIAEVILCVGYMEKSVRNYVGSGQKWGLRAAYSIERQLLGTGGALRKARHLVSGRRMLVINGDTLVKANLRRLVGFHESQHAGATLLVKRALSSGRYGTVRLDRRRRVRAFFERQQEQRRYPLIINAGVYVLEKSVLTGIQTRTPVSLECDVFPHLAQTGRIYGLVSSGHFIDIGIPEDFRRAQRELREW